MAQQSQGRFRRFLPTPLGRILIIVLAVLVVFATYVYVQVIVAIPAMLIFGLALPIWAGLKRPRFLALAGLVIVLTVAPISTLVITQEILTPVGLASSPTDVPLSGGKQLMQNAGVQPFSGTSSTNFTWTVTVNPQNVPKGNSTPIWLILYVSTCPGATGPSSPYCTQPYPFHQINYTLNPNATAPFLETFHYQIGSNGIWDWQMGIYSKNNSTGKPYFQLLAGDPTYNGIEGPVIGGYATIYSELILTVYFQDFLFLAAPFYFVLLVYMLFKNRERRRKEMQQRAPGPTPPEDTEQTPSPPTKASPLPSSRAPPSTGSAATSATAADELNCPKCNAVVYAGEESCWKCGASLGQLRGKRASPG